MPPPIGRAMTALFLMWLALVGADRISLLGDRGPFVLTPFLALTPLVIVLELYRRHRTHSALALGRDALTFLALALMLLCLAVASVFASRDFSSSAPRAVQLALMIAGTFGVVIVARDRNNFNALLAQGARVGLLFFLLFNVAQLLAFFHVIPDQLPESLGMLRLAPDVYSGVLPRLSGMVIDSNRGGLLLVLFAFLVMQGDENDARRWRWFALALMLLLLTLSRSAILGGAGALLVILASKQRIRVPHRVLAAVSLVVATTSATLLFNSKVRETVAIGLQPVLQRLTVIEGSSQDHLRLLERGVQVATKSVDASVHGIGYGSSHLALQDFFPGDRYGNFHSVYVGIFAESGVFALVVLLCLLGVPLFRAGTYRPMVVAAALFGVFYGALSEPVFWLALVLAWTSLPAMSSRLNAITKPTATASTAPSNS